jgi:cation:H+ antiporter
MTWTILALLALGLGLLVAGGELLVRGASRLAAAFGISPLVVGLTVVAFGTSSPELAVSLQASFAGQSDLALANVVGSNIFNVLVVLGACALVAPLTVATQVVRIEVPLMIVWSLLAFALALDGRIGRGDGLLLVACLVAYTFWTMRRGRREGDGSRQRPAPGPGASLAGGERTAAAIAGHLLRCAAGLVLLVAGARWFVAGATAIAHALGVSDVTVGLTIVAVGTSLPEVATSLVATLRGERDIAVGNAVGSNVFNLLSILGIAALATPGGLVVAGSLLRFDLPVMLAVAMAGLPLMLDGGLARWEGALFLGLYAAYTVYLVLAASHHAALATYSVAMLGFVLPLVVLTLVVVGWQGWRKRRAARAT